MVIYLQPVYLKVFLRRNVIKTMFLVCSKLRHLWLVIYDVSLALPGTLTFHIDRWGSFFGYQIVVFLMK